MTIQLPAVQLEKHSKLYWILSDSWILSVRSVKHITRSLDQMMSAVMFPIMFFLLFRYVFGGAIDTGDVTYVNFLVAGILVQTLAFGANTTTLSVAIDLQKGIVDRFRSLPMTSSAVLTGHVVSDLVRNMVSTCVMLAVSFLVGFQPVATPLEWGMVFALAAAFSLAISWVSAILGLFVKTIEAAQWVGFVIIFPLTFVSSAFVPTDTMPAVLRAFAENQPLTHVIGAMRAWLVGTPMAGADVFAFAWCIGIIAVSLPLSAYLFRKQGAR